MHVRYHSSNGLHSPSSTSRENLIALLMHLISIRADIFGFDPIKELYHKDRDFAEIWKLCHFGHGKSGFHLHDDFLFWGNQLCILETSLSEKLIRELHSSGLSGHFGRDKILFMVQEK